MKVTGGEISMTIYENATIDPTRIAPMLESFGGRMRFISSGKPGFAYTLTDEDRAADKIGVVGRVLSGMGCLIA